VQGLPTTAGSNLLLDNSASTDATVVRRLTQAGMDTCLQHGLRDLLSCPLRTAVKIHQAPIRRGIGGHVVDVEFVGSHSQAKFIPVDEQPNDDIVHLNGSRKADRLAYQPLDAYA
jgi:hypothetical protein